MIAMPMRDVKGDIGDYQEIAVNSIEIERRSSGGGQMLQGSKEYEYKSATAPLHFRHTKQHRTVDKVQTNR